MTRMWPGAFGSRLARYVFTRCGTCVEVHTVKLSKPASYSASVARHSIGTAARRGTSKLARTTWSAAANAASTSPAPAAVRITTLELDPGCSTGASGLAAARGSITGSSGS